MPPRHVRLVSTEQIAAMPTHRLLAYRNKLLGLEESRANSDWTAEELTMLESDLLYFKEDPRWHQLFQAIKDELSGRPDENAERGRND